MACSSCNGTGLEIYHGQKIPCTGCGRNTLVVNLFGGPGTGKSTTAAGIFSLLKQRGILAELIQEYAKDKVWELSSNTLRNQLYVFGKQHHRLWRVNGQVDVAVTDSPLLLSIYYGRENSDTFKTLVREEHAKLRNLNIYLRRVKSYEPSGRLQTEEEAKKIDVELLCLLAGKKYVVHDADEGAPEAIANIVCRVLGRGLD